MVGIALLFLFVFVEMSLQNTPPDSVTSLQTLNQGFFYVKGGENF